MSSSTELRPGLPLLRGEESAGIEGVRMPDLGTGQWERWSAVEDAAVDARASARAQGYAVGWAEGRREAEAAVRAELELDAERRAATEARRRQQHEDALCALHQAAERLAAATAETCQRVDGQAARLALGLTRELVGRAPAGAEHVLDRVAALLPDHPVARVRLHPEVAAVAADLREHGVSVVGDPDLAPGDALVEVEDHVLDLRVEAALTRLTEVLA